MILKSRTLTPGFYLRFIFLDWLPAKNSQLRLSYFSIPGEYLDSCLLQN